MILRLLRKQYLLPIVTTQLYIVDHTSSARSPIQTSMVNLCHLRSYPNSISPTKKTPAANLCS